MSVHDQTASPDVAIVGAGLIGLAIACELAARGASVTVFDSREPASQASWAGAGMLAPFSEGTHDPALAALSSASLARYPAFVERLRRGTGLDPAYAAEGTLHVALDGVELARLHALEGEVALLGARARRLDRGGVHALEPLLAARAAGGLLIEGEGVVDNRRLGRALLAAARAAGVRIERSDVPVAIEADARRVRGVRSSRGYHPAGTAINAAGAWAAELGGVPLAVRVPVRPRKGQMLALAVPKGFAERAVWSSGIYLVSRGDGRLLVGATVEDCGFDTHVTAAGIAQLLGGALRAAPALGAFTICESWAGLRPGSHDGRPYLGATPLEGYLVATGHYRNGILLAPVTAEAIADVVEGRVPAVDLGPFAPGRPQRVAA